MTAHPVAIIPLSLLPVGKSVSVVSCTASHYWAEVGGVSLCLNIVFLTQLLRLVVCLSVLILCSSHNS